MQMAAIQDTPRMICSNLQSFLLTNFGSENGVIAVVTSLFSRLMAFFVASWSNFIFLLLFAVEEG